MEGIIFILLFVGYLVFLVFRTKSTQTMLDQSEEKEDEKKRPMWLSIIFVIIGIVGIVFDETKYLTVELPNGIRNNGGTRESNFNDAAEKLQKVWVTNPDAIPSSIKTALDEKKLSIDDALPEDLVSIIRTKSNGWVMHENIDMKTITLVPRALHDAAEGGVSHMGGFSLAGYVKTHMGQTFFDRFVAFAATGSVIAQ
jgi:Ca2+/Na+ antiporter